MTVLGTPLLGTTDLIDGSPFFNGWATYNATATAALNDPTKLVFDYTVIGGEEGTDFRITSIYADDGSIIRDSFGSELSLGWPGVSLTGVSGADTDLQINGPHVFVGSTFGSYDGTPFVRAVNTGGIVKFYVSTVEGFSNKAVTVTGTPELTLNDGGVATYDAASSTPSSGNLTFVYTVGAGEHTGNLAITGVVANGASVQLVSDGRAVDLSTANGQYNYQINTPLITTIDAVAAGGNVPAGETIQLIVTMNEDVTVAGGTPTLTLNDGAVATFDVAATSDLADPKKLVFSYTVGDADYTTDLQITAFDADGATITDSAGNAADLSLADVTGVDTDLHVGAPWVMSMASSPGPGQLQAGDVVTFTVTMSEAVTVAGGTPVLELSDNAVAEFDAAATAALSDPARLVFRYTVQAGDVAADLQVVGFDTNGATITDSDGRDAYLSVFTVPGT
ncbi:MAG: hypothetical protein F9K43_22910, partial [Bauldia sp.]